MNENSSFFKILSSDKKSKARIGEINTSHGKILTPAFVPVGSQATVKSLTPQDLKEIGTQVFFVNTYHLYLRPGAEVVEKLGGLHKFMSWFGPIMTDSGGFQVFSLGRIEGDDTLKLPTTGPVAGSSRPTASPRLRRGPGARRDALRPRHPSGLTAFSISGN